MRNLYLVDENNRVKTPMRQNHKNRYTNALRIIIVLSCEVLRSGWFGRS